MSMRYVTSKRYAVEVEGDSRHPDEEAVTLLVILMIYILIIYRFKSPY